jgi:hypothetical protein
MADESKAGAVGSLTALTLAKQVAKKKKTRRTGRRGSVHTESLSSFLAMDKAAMEKAAADQDAADAASAELNDTGAFTDLDAGSPDSGGARHAALNAALMLNNNSPGASGGRKSPTGATNAYSYHQADVRTLLLPPRRLSVIVPCSQ